MDKSLRNPPAGRAMRLALALGALLCVAPAAQAQTVVPPRGADQAPDEIRPWLGAWDLEQVGAPRQCTITFGAEAAAQGRKLRFPATCRRALPVLDRAVGWSVSPNGKPRLNDALGQTVIAFGQGSALSGLEGQGPDGKAYRLDSKAHPRSARRPAPGPAELAASAAARPTLVDPAAAPAPEALPGRYAMMRQANREACRLMLATGPVNSAGRAPAAFDGRCQDTGLSIFDPVGWRYAGGRLALVARKGHSIDLVFENGLWRKDPAVGAPLLLRRLSP